MVSGFNSMNISASGLTAERFVMDVISNNIANAQTTRTPDGGPYRREIAVLAPNYEASNFSTVMNQAVQNASSGTGGEVQDGVRVEGVVQDQSPFNLVYDPTSPDAVNGYVQMPNVDISQEMVDMVSASKAYEANVTAFDAAKQMNMDALTIGK